MTLLVDTDVLIWHLRDHAQATHRLDGLSRLTISAVTEMEILQGLRNRHEWQALRRMFERRSAQVMPLSADISAVALELMNSLTLSHGLQMADALIAATARVHGLAVLTGNVRHFSPVPLLAIEPFAI
ncbi:type II toxin-antitoxin system VapC family toxin [Sphaerotilus mobilis]|uniref:Ribonuclease VapC n=1 Tax=Sphaerotilus mobilis TaxID=47994 RepID=A0A4Q7LX00_9BURK|nr:type II toxin-antitoxin system VapC family toxin [Sphaerotilus mobilis]RZS58738.1 hypothetical protein EV685_1036 [Sphaerotilus mobilis]